MCLVTVAVNTKQWKSLEVNWHPMETDWPGLAAFPDILLSAKQLIIIMMGLHLPFYLCVTASKERMMQHKECFGAKSFESVAFERFVR